MIENLCTIVSRSGNGSIGQQLLKLQTKEGHAADAESSCHLVKVKLK